MRKPKYEIKVNSSVVVEVSKNIFRSWSGERYLNGVVYIGPHYYYLSKEVTEKA